MILLNFTIISPSYALLVKVHILAHYNVYVGANFYLDFSRKKVQDLALHIFYIILHFGSRLYDNLFIYFCIPKFYLKNILESNSMKNVVAMFNQLTKSSVMSCNVSERVNDLSLIMPLI